mmetsp:Transcript_91609/g.245421  ORF Transcript_91609/g.245421 Transcript_91609/m.245421 type:complete len:195 (+) Transcript_91609:46-630(+)
MCDDTTMTHAFWQQRVERESLMRNRLLQRFYQYKQSEHPYLVDGDADQTYSMMRSMYKSRSTGGLNSSKPRWSPAVMSPLSTQFRPRDSGGVLLTLGDSVLAELNGNRSVASSSRRPASKGSEAPHRAPSAPSALVHAEDPWDRVDSRSPSKVGMTRSATPASTAVGSLGQRTQTASSKQSRSTRSRSSTGISR